MGHGMVITRYIFAQIFKICKSQFGCWGAIWSVFVVLGLIYNLYSSLHCLSNIGETWWCNQIETSFALLAFCAGNSPVPGEFPSQRPVTRSFGVFLDLCLNKRLSKQRWGWWVETLSCSLWRHSKELSVDSSRTKPRMYHIISFSPEVASAFSILSWKNKKYHKHHAFDLTMIRSPNKTQISVTNV